MADEDTQPGGKTLAKLHQLQQPENLHAVLKRDIHDDCLACRLTGAGAFVGLGAYSYFTGQKNLRLQEQAILRSSSRFGMKSRQAGIRTIAASFVIMGFWRLVN